MTNTAAAPWRAAGRRRLPTILSAGVLVALGAAVILLSLVTPAKAEVTLTFGVYASDKPTSICLQFARGYDELTLEESKVLSALEAEGFLPGDDAEYDVMRTALDRNREFIDAGTAQLPG